jgi:hypothetical protein
MKLNLKNLPAIKSMEIVQYCWDNQIEPKKCMDFVYWRGDLDFEFDIPDEHITWMTLKGYFNE